MGKTTLYHPLSLHVIRGAAEYCGWKFKHIKQTSSDIDEGWARYTAQIEIMPKEVWRTSLDTMQQNLQSCFLDDIRIYYLRKTRTGKWFVDIVVRLIRESEAVAI